MKRQRKFYFDRELCIGCQGCSGACKNANQTQSDRMWRTVHRIPATHFLSMSCNHCEHPPCLEACPTRSYTKRAEDGVVIHHPETCMGCKYCQMACPFDAIKWNEQQGIVSKCHFCFEKLDANQQPACVSTCFAGALTQRVSDDENGFNAEIELSPEMPEVAPSIRFVKRTGEGKPDRVELFPPTIPTEVDP